jgi:phage-related minor tail protein
LPDIASLGIAVDATQVDAGAAKLDNLTAASERAEASTGNLGKASAATSAEMQALQTKAIAAMAAQNGLTEAQAAAALGFRDAAKAATETEKAYSAAQKEAELMNATANRLKASIDPMAKAQLAYKQTVADASAALKAGALTQQDYIRITTAAGKAANEAASAMTHAAGATSTVTRETLVLGREALRGNWTRMAGSATILAQAMGVLSYALSPVAIGIELVTAAMIGGFVVAGNYNAALQATNDIAAGVGVTVGLTGDSIRAAAEAGATAANVSIGTAEKQAAVYAQTGKISSDVMTGLIGVTERYAQATGEKAADANKELAKAFADPAKGAEELDGKLNFLTATQLQNIKTMADSGDKLGAQRELMKDLETGLDGVKAKTDAWTNSLKSIGDTAHAALIDVAKLFSYDPSRNDLDYSGFPGSQATPGVQAKNAAAAAAAAKTAAGKDRDQVKAGYAIAQQYDLGGTKQQLELEDKLAQVELALAAAKKTNSDQTGALIIQDQALSRAVTSFVGPAQKAHDIAVAQLAVTNATTPAQKGAAAAALVRAKAEGEVATQAEINQRATDAAREATDKEKR